jgi:hypothetical protein
MRSPEETSSGCGGVNTPTQEPDLFSDSVIRKFLFNAVDFLDDNTRAERGKAFEDLRTNS